MNAFTTQEQTVFYVRVPDEQLELAVDILSDIVWSPAFRPDEVDSERQVILEEIRMRDDTPDDLVHDVFAGAVFPKHPLGREVIGSPETIQAMSRQDIVGFHADHYHPSNVVIAVAGNLDHDRVVELVDAALVGVDGERARPRPPRRGATAGAHGAARASDRAGAPRPRHARDPARRPRPLRAHRAEPGARRRHVVATVPGGPRAARPRVLRVFVPGRVRGDRRASRSTRARRPSGSPELLEVLDDQLERLIVDRGVTERELDAAKGHLTGSLALSLESSSSRMHRLGRSELTLDEIPTLDELVAEIDEITPDDIARVIDRVLATPQRTVAAVGPVTEDLFADIA